MRCGRWKTRGVRLGRCCAAGRTDGINLHRETPPRRMSTEERLVADFAGVGVTTGSHPMTYHRSTLR